MRKEKETQTTKTRVAPETKPSVGEKLEIETQNPLRPPERHYHGANVGYDTNEVTGNRAFRTQDAFTNDSDDDQLIDGELAEAGADEPQSETDMSRDDAIKDDREFELAKIGTEEVNGGGLTDEDNDLEEIPDRRPLQVDRDL